MTIEMFSINSGLSIEIMNKLDKYRSDSVSLLNNAQLPYDVTVALRQQVNKDIDTAIDTLGNNPSPPVVVVTPAPFEMPKITTRNVSVFVSDVPVATVPTPPVAAA